MIKDQSNNKRIAKNTVVLYIRSIIVMILSLYTSRVILQALGVEDYGLYNVIGGVVALFSFLRTSMTKSTQRYLNVEMAKDVGDLESVFRVSLTLHVLISVFALLLAETIGLWLLNTYIQIPEGREFAAAIVYQSTIISLVFTILTVPYSACLIAHERMDFFAIVSIVDAVLKLLIAWAILLDGFDKLIVYGYLLMLISILNLLMYIVYCKRKFIECKNRLLFDRVKMRDMIGYTTWTVVGQAAIVGTNQGNSILVNMFHSVSANAAMGVASQINSAVVSLTSNFQTAFNPQITKSYAARNYNYLRFLIYTTSKISFFLLTCVSLPIMLNIDMVLSLWLKNVPQDSGIFCILVLWNSILNALSAPLNFTVLSSNKIRNFQIATSITYLLDLIILYCFFLAGAPAIMAMYVKVGIMVAVLFVRLHYCSKEVECISMGSYLKDVLAPLLLSCGLSFAIAYVFYPSTNSFVLTLLYSVVVFAVACAFSFVLGLSKEERKMVLEIVKKKKHKL